MARRTKAAPPAPAQPPTAPAQPPTAQPVPLTAGRSTLHEVLRSRKATPHRRRNEQRTTQKLKRELEGDG